MVDLPNEVWMEEGERESGGRLEAKKERKLGSASIRKNETVSNCR